MEEKHLTIHPRQTSIVIREIKSTLTPVQMALINQTNDSLFGENEERGMLIHCSESVNWYSHYRNQCDFPQKSENRIISRLSYAALDCMPKGFHILLQRYLFINAHCFSLHNTKKSETA